MIYNLGSINVDWSIQLERAPDAGETVFAKHVSRHMGGKGLNQSIAIHRQGGKVFHIGAIGRGDTETIRALSELGIETSGISEIDAPTGSAYIMVEPDGENRIVVNSGANKALTSELILQNLSQCQPDDWLLVQNETNGQSLAIEAAKNNQAKVALVPAPFCADLVREHWNTIDLLVVNRIEYDMLQEAGLDLDAAVNRGMTIVVTLGSDGARWISRDLTYFQSAEAVETIDTTGAGDTFTGVLLAGLAAGESPQIAMATASMAAAKSTTSGGAIPSIPWR